jgi:hypothetical protein
MSNLSEKSTSSSRGLSRATLSSGTERILESARYRELHLTSTVPADIGTGRIRPLKLFNAVLHDTQSYRVARYQVYYRVLSTEYLVLSHTAYQQLLMKQPLVPIIAGQRELHLPKEAGFTGQLVPVRYELPVVSIPRLHMFMGCFVHSVVPEYPGESLEAAQLFHQLWQTFIAMYRTTPVVSA